MVLSFAVTKCLSRAILKGRKEGREGFFPAQSLMEGEVPCSEHEGASHSACAVQLVTAHAPSRSTGHLLTEKHKRFVS